MLQMIHSLHLHRLKTDHADNKLVCNLSVLGKTDLLQICCRSAGFVRGILPSNMSTSSFAYNSLNSSARVVSSTFFLISASTKKKPIISYFVYFKTIYQTNFSNIIEMFN